MSRKMLINATHPEEHRVAIVEDGFLTELDIEITGKEQTKGNIYKAAVVRVETGLQAAFVDYGGERLGFLQISELHPSLYPASEDDRRHRPRINDILRSGQEILVQVLKEERGTKGAALTTFLSLAGRYMVLMPESPTKGVSRKIEEESERKKLKKAMAELDLPENMGYIVRTAGIGKAPDELRRDFDNLVNVYRNIQERSRQVKAPSLIFRESNLIIRCIRDYFTEDTEEVLVDDPAVFEEARDFFRMLMPDKVRLVKLHQERRPIFSRYQIEEQIETINQNKVALPSGGSIVLDATEALVAIDVNSGKMASEQGIEGTAYKTNLEAAVESARQLRLRDLAGLIVIDFIDMRDRKHIRAVEKALRDALKSDKARVTVGRISQFGLLEMSRQRLKPSLAAASYLTCPHCQGHGRIKSIEAQGLAFLRRIHSAVAKGQIRRIEGRLPLEAAGYLLNTKREELLELERRYDLEIVLLGQSNLLPHQAEINPIRRDKEEEAREKQDFSPIEHATQIDQSPPPAPSPEPAPQEPAEALTVATPAAGGTSEEEGGKKKRRRRRRRKKSSADETPSDQAMAQEGVAEAADEIDAGEPVREASPVPAAPAAVPEAAGEPEGAPAAPPRKRSRSRRTRKPVAAAKAAEATATQHEGEAGPPAAAGEISPHPPAAQESLPVAPPDATPASEEVAAPAATNPAVEKPASAPRKRRARAKKPETASPEAPDKGTQAPTPPSATPPAPAEEGGTATPPQPEQRAEEAPLGKKPTPRRRAPRKPADAAAEKAGSAKAQNEAGPQTGEETAEKAPAKPRRTRRTPSAKPKKPAEVAAEAAAATPTESAGAAEKPAPVPKPRTRRTAARKKKTEPDEGSPKPDAEQ